MKTKNRQPSIQHTADNSGERLTEEIARRAFLLWEAEGSAAGKDIEYWLRAEVLVIVSSAAPQTDNLARR